MRDLRRVLYGVGCAALGLAFGPIGAVAAKDTAAGGCAVLSQPLAENANRSLQRVVNVKQDAQHRSRWAVMVDCEHPEWPARMVLLPASFAVAAPVATASLQVSVSVAVRAGSMVRLSKHDSLVSMETTGVAMENGALGKRIRVRLARHGMDGVDTASYVWGVVRGTGELEIVP